MRVRGNLFLFEGLVFVDLRYLVACPFNPVQVRNARALVDVC